MKPDPDKQAQSQPPDDSAGFLIRKCAEGEGFKIGPDVEVHVNKIAGARVSIAIKAPRTTKIERSDKS